MLAGYKYLSLYIVPGVPNESQLRLIDPPASRAVDRRADGGESDQLVARRMIQNITKAMSAGLCQCGIGEQRRGEGRIDPTWQMQDEIKRKKRWSEPWALDGLPPTTVSNARSLAGQLMADAKRGKTAGIVAVLDSDEVDEQQGAVLLAAGDLANGNTALMLAAKSGHADTVQLLLARGADPNALNRQNQTAFDIAKAAGYTEVLDKLTNNVPPVPPSPATPKSPVTPSKWVGL